MGKHQIIYELLPAVAMLVTSWFGFAYGIRLFMKKGKPLFWQILICGFGCLALGQLYNVVLLVTQGEIPKTFNVGMLSTVGAYFFFYSAAYGQMDSLVDDGQSQNRKYRIAGAVAALIVACVYIPAALSDACIGLKISYGLLFLVFAGTTYFNVKHLIMPDIEGGFIKTIAEYNIAILVVTGLKICEIYASVCNNENLKMIMSYVLAVMYLGLIIIISTCYKRWKLED